MGALAETKEVLADLVAFPTVSSEPNLDIIAYLADRLTAAGAEVELFHDADGRKANLFARIGPRVPGGVLLSGHTDVVPVAGQPWSSDPFTLREAEGRLYGRGTCDMKGFIAACLASLGGLRRDRLARPLFLSLTHDEEVGCLGARDLVGHLLGRDLLPAVGIIGEPTGMHIVEGHKGCCEYTTVVTGLEGHGSEPDAGVNAAAVAARYAGRLLALAADLRGRAPDDSPFTPAWTTINIGRISGGTAHNVIPARAEIDWEMRPVRPGDALFVKDALARFREDELLPGMRHVFPGAEIETRVIGEIDALRPTPGNAALRLLTALTGANSAGTVAFATEAGLFQSLGMDVVVCGPGSIAQAHMADEFVSVAELEACLAMLARLIESLERPL